MHRIVCLVRESWWYIVPCNGDIRDETVTDVIIVNIPIPHLRSLNSNSTSPFVPSIIAAE
jgi:hypothetical protein